MFANAKQYFSDLHRELEGPPGGKRFRLWAFVVAPLFLLLLVTLFVRWVDFDLRIQRTIFHAGGDSWIFGDRSLWSFIYRFGSVPLALVVVVSVVGYALSWYSTRWRKWRKVFLFNMLLAILAPGVITNAMLKEYWGRPRPREIVGMGGHQPFEPIMTIDPKSDGKSFPCGHATVGFYFLGGFFLLRRNRRGMAAGFLFFGLTFGGLLGIARMAQGGHFFSDVIYAAAVCYFTSAALYYALRLDRGTLTATGGMRLPLWGKLTIIVVGLAVIGGILLGSPYQKSRNWFPVQESSKSGPLEFELILVIGNVEVNSGPQLLITGEAYGHGVPTSKVGELFLERTSGEGSEIVYKERLSGWFTEVEEYLDIDVPWHRLTRMKLDTGAASVNLDMREIAENRTVFLTNGTGRVTLQMGAHDLKLVNRSTVQVVEARTRETEKTDGNFVFTMEVDEAFEGTIEIVP